MKKQTTKKKIDPDKLVDTETGELLSSSMPGVKSVNQVNEDLVIMHSDEYVVIDSHAFLYIQENFSPTDIGRILKMANMTYGEYNVLYNNRIPHTKGTLMETLEYSRNKFADFMRRLEKKRIIYYIVGYDDNEKRVRHIMLNPHVARKRKTINVECLNVFPDVRKIKDDE
jgi:hypothetical protein